LIRFCFGFNSIRSFGNVVGLIIDGCPLTNCYWVVLPLCVPREVMARACMLREFCALEVVFVLARVVFGTIEIV
jgi:hypothetical protein